MNHGTANSTSFRYDLDKLGRMTKVTRNGLPAAKQDVSYTYDMHGWLQKIVTNSFTEELYYASGEGTKYYNGNISSIKWKDNTSTSYRGYKYTYDIANRMTAGTYGEGSSLTTNVDRYSERMGYDANGNITLISRYGKQSSGYGLMDNLTITYSGNQLSNVSETVADYDYSGSFEYKKAKGSQYMYNRNGSLIADKSRGIVYITYDFNNNPKQIYFDNGNVTKYVYSASGEKLRVVHYTAKPNITRQFGIKPTTELTLAQILQSDSTDYLIGGSLVLKNGKIDKLLFDGGYAKATATGTYTDSFAFYYHNQDHLGNNREVVDSSGNVVQVTNYYPFGAPYADASAVKGATLQQYKYNGKELDTMHGLNSYDYGARQYYPVVPVWDRMDPLCEKYYGVSPYAYCANNPIMFIDPDGRDTLNIAFNGNKWSYESPIVSKGDDVFNVTINNITQQFTFTNGKYEERVNALNLEINDNYTLGVYHISGTGNEGTGFYVAPGGTPSIKEGSGKRIPDGEYPILAPSGGQWQQPQVGGSVCNRGIRFHYGAPDPRKWTQGCFVLSSDYSLSNGGIRFQMNESQTAVQNFDYCLGGGAFYQYKTRSNKLRYGSRFHQPIKHKLYLKSR